MFSEEIEKRPVRQSGLAITRHAGRRMQQRGLREPDVQLVRACGTAGPYGRTVLLDRDIDREIRECKQRIQSLERLRGCVVVSEDGVVVTAYHAVGQAGRQVLRRRRNRDPWRRRPAKRKRNLHRRPARPGARAGYEASKMTVDESGIDPKEDQ